MNNSDSIQDYKRDKVNHLKTQISNTETLIKLIEMYEHERHSTDIIAMLEPFNTEIKNSFVNLSIWTLYMQKESYILRLHNEITKFRNLLDEYESYKDTPLTYNKLYYETNVLHNVMEIYDSKFKSHNIKFILFTDSIPTSITSISKKRQFSSSRGTFTYKGLEFKVDFDDKTIGDLYLFDNKYEFAKFIDELNFTNFKLILSKRF